MENERNTDKLAGYIIKLGGLAMVLALCWYFKNVLIYIVVAFVVSMIGRPLMQLMRRIKIKGKSAPDWLLAVLTILLIFFFLTMIVTQMIPLVSGIVKEASAIVSSIYAICGKPYSQEGKKLLGVPFAQFVKATLQYTRQFPLTKRSLIAMRTFGGFVYSYGNAKSAPYSELFSVGGANSIRAFGMRTIGPGAYHPERSQYSYIDQMGDFKLEANVEYRFPIIGKLNGAAFLDAGNVWLLRDSENQPGGKFTFKDFGKQIALGTGVGIRYDLDFLVIRFDLGVGIHAPYDTGKRGYYNMKSFGKSLGYHFAIGYPF